jgi:hypothetical protein
MTLNSTGLGIGATPLTKFHVQDATLTGAGQIRELLIKANSNNVNNSFNSLIGLTFNSSAVAYTAGSLDRTSGVYGINLDNAAFGRRMGLVFYTSTQDAAATEKMRIDDAGNVGIGVAPSAWTPLDRALQFAYGNSIATATSTNFSIVRNAQELGGGWTYSANGFVQLYNLESDGGHKWYTAASGTAGNLVSYGSAKMTLDTLGNLLVGTTSALSAWATRLTLSTDAGTTKWAVGPYAATTNFIISASGSFGVYLNGTSAVSWTGISDERLKDIIEPISNAVAKVGKLRSVIGKFKADETNTRRSFLLAQDVQAVLPEAVDASNPDRLGVAYTDVIPLLVAAIKELTTRVQTLEAR